MNRNPMKELYEKLTTELSVSAREYFMILRLAIYHTDGMYLKTSYEITQYDTSKESYELACRILKTLNGGDRK